MEKNTSNAHRAFRAFETKIKSIPSFIRGFLLSFSSFWFALLRFISTNAVDFKHKIISIYFLFASVAFQSCDLKTSQQTIRFLRWQPSRANGMRWRDCNSHTPERDGTKTSHRTPKKKHENERKYSSLKAFSTARLITRRRMVCLCVRDVADT